MPRSPFRTVALAALPCLLATLPAQQPSAWTQLTPPGGAAAARLQTLAGTGRFGKLALYRDGQYLRVFSTVTGRFHAHTPSFGTTPILFDEILLVPESDRWTALAARRGVFETLLVDQPNTTRSCNGTIAVVRHQDTVHVFSALTGRWHSRAMPASWNAGLRPHLATFGPNANSTAFVGFTLFDAVTGQWHDLPAPATDRLSVGSFSGSTGMVLLTRPDQSRYLATWTARQPAWQFHALGATPPLWNLGGGGASGADFVCLWDASFSGLTGTLTSLGAAVAPSNEGLVATAYDTTTGLYRCLSAWGTAWVPIPAGAIGRYTSTESRSVRLFAHGSVTHAFDGATGQLVTGSCDMGQFAEGGYEGRGYGLVVDGAGMPHIYSTVAGDWLAMPGDVLAEAQPHRPGPATPAAAVLRTGAGVTAFSSRTGRFVPLPGSGLQRLVASTLVDGPGTTHVFDERTARWLSTPALPMRSVIDPHGFVAAGPTTATGYGARASRLETIPLPEPALQVVALEGGGIVRTQHHLFAFAGLPATLSLHAFPEEPLATGPGGVWRQQLRLGAGHAALHAFAPRLPGPSALPPFGTLWLDPPQAALQFLVGAPGEERVLLQTPIPSLAALRGTEWTVQALVLPPTGTPWLTDPSSLLLP